MIDNPLEVCAVRTAEVSPHVIPVSRIANRRTMSRSPSPESTTVDHLQNILVIE
jgi:hypothetical protein